MKQRPSFLFSMRLRCPFLPSHRPKLDTVTELLSQKLTYFIFVPHVVPKYGDSITLNFIMIFVMKSDMKN